ncbi:MAG: EcsC family protein [Synechococcales bacterium]|nr:EcsC family protein [Synechococcales bacterium]
MTDQDKRTDQDWMGFAWRTSQAIANTIQQVSTQAGEQVGNALYERVESGTEALGQVITPIATHPLVQMATKMPGLNWLMAALGQVDVVGVQREVETLKQTYPQETAEALAQRVISDTAWKAAGIGLATNFVPPLALALLAVDLGAIAALEAEMIYRIAAIYGFSPTDAARRGEVLAIWGLSTGSSGVMKAGLSVVEFIPVVGAATGTVGNAAILYGLGQVACRFYEAKQRAQA